MSVKSEKLPPARTLLGVLDAQARASVQHARRDVARIVATETPRKSGQTAAGLRPRTSKTKTGAALTVRPPRGRAHGSGASLADVVRWVNRGTGLHRSGPGPKARIRAKRRIPPKRMILPGGRAVWSVAGQRPNPFMARIRQRGTPVVQRAFTAGAARAARTVERVIR